MRPAVLLPSLGLLLGLAVLVSLGLGRYPLEPGDLLAYGRELLLGGSSLTAPRLEDLHNVLVNIRLPRIAAAERRCACGSALATSILTRLDAIPAKRKQELDLLLGKYLG